MRKVHRSALVPYSAAQMFSLVDDVASYPEFLPWCSAADVHLREPGVVEATLELRRAELSRKFRTRNTTVPDSSIDMALVDGPFRHLEGRWTFTQLGDAGSKVELNLAFEFASSVIDAMLGSFFEDTCNSLVEAFIRRAREIYGADANE
jgi:ribosome-associated toxin RatA of RatAB toxin-antitoxin module